MAELFIIALGIAVLTNSCVMLATDAAKYASLIDRSVIFKVLLVFTVIALFIVIPWQAGAVARTETSVFPWVVWAHESREYGALNGIIALLVNLIFLLWIFLLPGHLYANSVAKTAARRPFYPYVINVLIGTILCTPENLVYQMIGFYLTWSR